jgi:hypothetical protein
MASKAAKPPFYYIQRFRLGKNCISQLGSWMIRELITYLSLEDFVALAGTCKRLSKFSLDPYVCYFSSLGNFCLGTPTSATLQQMEFLVKLGKGKSEPIRTLTEEVMLLTAFYYNSKRSLLYSYYQDNLKVFLMEVMSMTPIYLQTVPALPDIVSAVGFGRQFYLANTSSLVSLHEGQVEGLVYSSEEGWGSAVTAIEAEGKPTLEVMEGGQKVIMAQATSVRLYNYKLEHLQSLPGSSVYIPTPLAHSYIVVNQGNIAVYPKFPRDPYQINSEEGWVRISKVKASKAEGKDFLLYLQGNQLIINKTSLGKVQDFTVYKQHLFTYSRGKLLYTDLSKPELTTEPVSVNLNGANYLWMRADNHKLVLIYSCRDHFYLHITGFHKDKRNLRYCMPIHGYTRVVYRDDSVVIVHGFVYDDDEGTSRRHKVIIYSLERCCPVTAHSDDLLVSTPYACHIGTDYNFIRNLEGAHDCEYWQQTGARPLEFKEEYWERKSDNVLLAAAEWCEISQRILFRSNQRCRLSLGANLASFSWANTAYGQLRVLLWQDGGVVDSAESLEVTNDSTERSSRWAVYWTPIETHLDIPDGSFSIEVILRAKATGSFKVYLWNPTLKINYLN